MEALDSNTQEGLVQKLETDMLKNIDDKALSEEILKKFNEQCNDRDNLSKDQKAALQARLEERIAARNKLTADASGDNAAMIAWGGIERFRLGLTNNLDFPAKSRWPLDEKAPFLKGPGLKL